MTCEGWTEVRNALAAFAGQSRKRPALASRFPFHFRKFYQYHLGKHSAYKINFDKESRFPWKDYDFSMVRISI